MEYLSPPLPLPEVNVVAKQVARKDYAFKCSDAPINAHCNKDLCRTRKHGIGAAVSGATIANLKKIQLSTACLVYGRQRRASGVRHRSVDEPVTIPESLHGAA